MKNKALLFSTIIITIFFISLLTRNSDIAFVNVFFIAYLLWSILRAPAGEDIVLTADRTVEKFIADGEISVEVRVKIGNRGPKTLCLIAEDPLQKGMVIKDGSLKQCFALKGGADFEWSYSFVSSRGYYNWEKLSLIVSDPAGCMESPMDIPAIAHIAIPPRYKKLRPFAIRPRETLTAPGNVPSRRSGSSTDFYGVREYHPGDPLRTLDWKRTARYRNKFFTREFQQERTADIAIVVDGRKNRELRIGDRSLFESMIELAAALTQMFLHQGQRLGFYITGDNPIAVLPSYGKKQLHKILNSMAMADTGGDSSGDALYTLPLKQFSTKTQLFLLSPTNREDINYIRSLRSRGLQIILIRPDTYSFAFARAVPSDFNETGLRMGRLEQQCVKKMLSELSVLVIDWVIGEPVQPLIMRALNKR